MYDFETILDRRGHDALALDAIGGAHAPAAPKDGFSPIPMWVADMCFGTVPTAIAAMRERLEHPVFGYFSPCAAYAGAIMEWQRTQNGVARLTEEHIGYENGVLGGLLSALGAMCEPGAPVLVHSPTYGGFTRVLADAGYRAIYSPLVKDTDGVYRMDLADMEAKIRAEGIRAAIFCSPHNPTGRVWERGEIASAMALFRRLDVRVVSDEIWSDITLFGHTHIPTQSVSEDARMRTVALYAPSKTFNLAGLVGSYHIVYDPTLREGMERVAARSAYNHMNVLSMHALIGAYRPEGRAWLTELRQVLGENVRIACDVLGRIEGIALTPPEGTYMLLLDCRPYLAAHGLTMEQLLRLGTDVGVLWQDGAVHGAPDHIRINVALPTALLREALARLATYVFPEK